MFLKIDKHSNVELKQNFYQRLKHLGIEYHVIMLSSDEYIMLENNNLSKEALTKLPEACVVQQIYEPTGKRFFSTKFFKEESIIKVKNIEFNSRHFPIIAGPCSVESYEQICSIAQLIKSKGAHGLRGGAFKPRTSPYDFQGLGPRGLQYMRQAADLHGLFVVSEIMDINYLDDFLENVDLIQVGARNMQNFAMLKELGKIQQPILLKRGLSATYEEFLYAAEYIISHGNQNVILCERGIRTFESYSRNTLDITAVPVLKDLTHLPIIIDPSHAVGIRKYVPALAYSAVAAGADGLMVEVHTHPEKSYSDAKQTICPETFEQIVKKINDMAPIFNRTVCL
jgi:3-deoxy-7-phosphoheptulonate synthase